MKRRFGERGVFAGKTIEGIHCNERKVGDGHARSLAKVNADNIKKVGGFQEKESSNFIYFNQLNWWKRTNLLEIRNNLAVQSE